MTTLDNPSCFNPRARDGRENTVKESWTKQIGFNPRARDGRENIENENLNSDNVSIHAPVMDANLSKSISA